MQTESARPVHIDREGSAGDCLRQSLVWSRRSGATVSARRRRSRGGAPRPHHPADPRAKAADDRRPRCAKRRSAGAVRGQSPAQRAQRAHCAARRHGLRPVERFRRPDPYAAPGASGQRGLALQPVPHDGALLADPHRPADRTQPPHEQHGRHYRGRDGVSRQHRRPAERDRAVGRDSPPERLWNGGVRKISRGPGMEDQPGRAGRSMVDAIGLRQILRLTWRRNHPMGAADLRWNGECRAAARSRLSLHDGYDRPGHQLDEVGQGARAR